MRLIGTWGFFEHSITVVSLILALIFVSFVLQSKRPPGSTMAWLLFILLVPYVGIPFYIFLSQRKFKTRMNSKKSQYEPPPEALLQHGNLENILLSLGVSPPKEPSAMRLIDSGSKALECITRLTKNARRTIHLTTFIFADDHVGQEVLKLLEGKVREGVKVRILIDSLGSMWVKQPSFKSFQKAGGEIAHFMPFFHLPFKGRSNLRNHRKIFVVDSHFAVIGGMNVADEYMGSEEGRWIDAALELEGAPVGDLEKIFRHDWEFATKETMKVQTGDEDAEAAEPHDRVQIVASGPDVKGDPLYDFLLSALYGAKERIWIATPYFIPDESLSKALELAARRGVQVKIWVPKKSNHFLADLARATYLHDLFENGAAIRLVQKMMHGKAVIIDHEFAILGSANFDLRSLLLNYEVGAVLFSPVVMSGLESWFQKMPARQMEIWPQTSYWAGLFEGLGRVLGPLI